ncbi:MAG: alpha/beta hydrolase [Aquabacterium sp.]|nr:alpha/beta hydrolase [Aquabacterium sp.]
MIPFRFGSLDRALFGAFHPAEGAPAQLGVVLCNPFGQEAIRTHRVYRVLADRLAKAGIAVLRFDYFGTGESDGEDLDGDLTRWFADIRLAHETLQARSHCQQIAWLGTRLGGTLAMMAASQAGPQPQSLLLWEPVLDGRAYLKALAQCHQTATSRPYRPTSRTTLSEKPDGEALGFGMSDLLIQQIDQIDHASLMTSGTASITVITKPSDTETQDWLSVHQQMGNATVFMPLAEPFDWTSEEALNTALVPAAALKLLIKATAQVIKQVAA